MALQSGHGGSVQMGTGSITVVPVGMWRGNWRVREADVTQSDGGGSTHYQSVVTDPEWEFSAARDDTLFPESLGLGEGTIVAVMWFKHGAGTKADKLTGTLVVEVNPDVDNKGDVVRVTVRGKGGIILKNQTIA